MCFPRQPLSTVQGNHRSDFHCYLFHCFRKGENPTHGSRAVSFDRNSTRLDSNSREVASPRPAVLKIAAHVINISPDTRAPNRFSFSGNSSAQRCDEFWPAIEKLAYRLMFTLRLLHEASSGWRMARTFVGSAQCKRTLSAHGCIFSHPTYHVAGQGRG